MKSKVSKELQFAGEKGHVPCFTDWSQYTEILEESNDLAMLANGSHDSDDSDDDEDDVLFGLDGQYQK